MYSQFASFFKCTINCQVSWSCLCIWQHNLCLATWICLTAFPSANTTCKCELLVNLKTHLMSNNKWVWAAFQSEYLPLVGQPMFSGLLIHLTRKPMSMLLVHFTTNLIYNKRWVWTAVNIHIFWKQVILIFLFIWLNTFFVTSCRNGAASPSSHTLNV